MDTNPQPPDLTLLLPRSTYYYLLHTLRASLPPLVPDTPEALAHRDKAAIAHVASLLPANADEANLAALYVAADAQAFECLRLARQPGLDTTLAMKCNAQVASMMRQARATRTLLLRVQAERRKLEANSAAAEHAAWTEHCAAGLMMQALPGAPPMELPEPPAPPPPPTQAPEPVEPAQPDPIAAAEQYAAIYPRRAALIRQLGRVPDNVSFGPPDDDLVRALVTGTTPVLRALDTQPTT